MRVPLNVLLNKLKQPNANGVITSPENEQRILCGKRKAMLGDSIRVINYARKLLLEGKQIQADGVLKELVRDIEGSLRDN